MEYSAIPSCYRSQYYMTVPSWCAERESLRLLWIALRYCSRFKLSIQLCDLAVSVEVYRHCGGHRVYVWIPLVIVICWAPVR